MFTFLYSNIRGLLLKSNRNKPAILSDLLKLHNGVGVSVTESWLEEEVLDAEIVIDGFDIFRSDRSQRSRGGVSCYLRKDLKCIKYSEFSNGVVEYVIIKCKLLYTLFVTFTDHQILVIVNLVKLFISLRVT